MVQLISYVAGGLALFLYGMKRATDGLRDAAGGHLRATLSLLTARRTTGVLAGVVITFLVSSSSAIAVLLVVLGFLVNPFAHFRRGKALGLVLLTACLVFASSAVCRAGEMVGTLKPAERVKSVTAVDRDNKKTFAASWDAKTGEYRFRNIPAGVYDLVLETAAGRIEGVNLKVESAAAKDKVVTVKPAEMDKDDILRAREFLLKLCDERRHERPAADAIVARIREGKLVSAGLVKGKFGEENSSTVEAPLKDDEPSQLGEMLLGLISLARMRDQLPRDFDLVIDTPGGNAGDMRIVPASSELSPKDREWIVDWVRHINAFENKIRVLDLDGTGERVKALVEKLRDKQEGLTLPVKEPTAFWRVEIYDFRKYYGGWAPEKGQFVVFREQIPLRKFREYQWMFEKRLGGIRVAADGVTNAPPYEVPEKLDPARSVAPF